MKIDSLQSGSELPPPQIRMMSTLPSGTIRFDDVSHPGEVSVVMSSIDQRRQEFASGLEHKESGIDIPRVSAFMSHYGLAVKPFIVIDRLDMDAYKQRRDELYGVTPSVNDAYGQYLPEIDLAVVIKDDKQENLNPGFTESIVVHELAHANHHDALYTAFKEGELLWPVNMRSGFLGALLEEGFAGTMEMRYAQEVLGLEKGFLPEDHHLHEPFPDGSVFVLPGKYYTLGADGDYEYGSAHFAAYCIELLMTKDPTLFDSMLKSRKSSEGLREVAKKIEAIAPGLYKRLRDQPEDRGNLTDQSLFLEHAMYLIDELYGGDQLVANKAIELSHATEK